MRTLEHSFGNGKIKVIRLKSKLFAEIFKFCLRTNDESLFWKSAQTGKSAFSLDRKKKWRQCSIFLRKPVSVVAATDLETDKETKKFTPGLFFAYVLSRLAPTNRVFPQRSL